MRDLIEDDEKEGIEGFEQKEPSFAKNVGELSGIALEDCYSSAWGYYIRDKQKDKAKAIVTKGLVLFPDSKDLKGKLELSNE